jgi:transcriptional regulator of acetoin/glycerol metabolism
MSRDEALDAVREARAAVDDAEEALDTAMRAARAAGVPVMEVAVAAGMSKQTMYRRIGRR